MAAALMIKAQESFKDFGGVQDPAVAAKLQRLAPMLGAANISESDLDRIFKEEEKAQEDAWDEAEKRREKHAKHYVKPPKPKFGVAARDFESFLSNKIGMTSAQGQEYLKTPLGVSRSSGSSQGLADEDSTKTFIDWQQRMVNAQAEYGRLSSMGEDRWAPGKHEVIKMALESELEDIDSLLASEPDPDRKAQLAQLRKRVVTERMIQTSSPAMLLPPVTKSSIKTGIEAANTINIYNQHITQHRPIVHPGDYGARVGPNDI